jgi:NADP-dependent 3-hydroxy acid dehydrogenase YdfG
LYFAIAGATSIFLAGRDIVSLEETKARIQAEYPKVYILSVATDITDPKAVSNLFEKSGKVDILVNNAGSTGIIAPMADADIVKWWTAFVRFCSWSVRDQDAAS